MYLRQNIKGEGDHEKTDSSVKRGTGEQQQVKEREAARISAEIMPGSREGTGGKMQEVNRRRGTGGC